MSIGDNIFMFSEEEVSYFEEDISMFDEEVCG